MVVPSTARYTNTGSGNHGGIRDTGTSKRQLAPNGTVFDFSNGTAREFPRKTCRGGCRLTMPGALVARRRTIKHWPNVVC